ncbi:hypothetical protein ABZ412_21330 [Nocardia sp. NPDC005746]|uniref:hypothetical protein n=1 Tax=Nocardia sp. NPDC005746 TaxID=3157062 RepID=UPI0033FDBA99
MTEDVSARREFVFGLFLATVLAPLLAGLTSFAAILGAHLTREAAHRLRTARREKPVEPESPHLAAQRPLRHAGHRHARRALSTRRPGGVLH